ncbi:hypothetical protein BS50DRAFT_638067 [Corynespora cassiicola Philippines]|uniref:DUF7580 domain-containing protein n=1 Tax=Corynespora cassiicola Philippines TaxID=1448308 RepID=A0A2T2NAH4_CORCC|nr:hypothetical protein BS50DRAFT_638067 [Corynespora cassiicola Philippines]
MRKFSMGHESRNEPKTNDCSKFLALAILLLEINFGRAKEDMRQIEDLGSSQVHRDMIDLQTAGRWYKAESRNLSAGFSQAILTCLQEYLNPDANFQDREYCDMVKEKILQPLENEAQYVIFGPPQ